MSRPNKIPTIPFNSSLKVLATHLGEAFLQVGISGYFSRVGDFFEFHGFDTATIRSQYASGTIGFNFAVNQIYSRGNQDTWSALIFLLVNDVYGKIESYNAGEIGADIGQVSNLSRIYTEIERILESLSFRIDDGRITQIMSAEKFISESIFGSCNSAPIGRGDLQVNSIMGVFHALKPDSVILDIGAGKGRCLAELRTMSNFSKWNYIGLNIDENDKNDLLRYISQNELKNCLSLDLHQSSPLNSDFTFCTNVLHALDQLSTKSLFETISIHSKIGTTIVIHDMSIPNEGEPNFLSWDANLAEDVLTPWCSNISGRNFESKSGTKLWTITATVSKQFIYQNTLFKSALESRKKRLNTDRKTASAEERVIINELLANLDDRINEV